jgi:hypothetical protein
VSRVRSGCCRRRCAGGAGRFWSGRRPRGLTRWAHALNPQLDRITPAGSAGADALDLAPVTRQSGRSIHGEHRSRRGNHRLKNALWLAAFCSLHHQPARDYYARKRSEGKKHNAAILCLARRRCDLIHKMLVTGLSYGEIPDVGKTGDLPLVAMA